MQMIECCPGSPDFHTRVRLSRSQSSAWCCSSTNTTVLPHQLVGPHRPSFDGPVRRDRSKNGSERGQSKEGREAALARRLGDIQTPQTYRVVAGCRCQK